jgi:hypothetical protein
MLESPDMCNILNNQVAAYSSPQNPAAPVTPPHLRGARVQQQLVCDAVDEALLARGVERAEALAGLLEVVLLGDDVWEVGLQGRG